MKKLALFGMARGIAACETAVQCPYLCGEHVGRRYVGCELLDVHYPKANQAQSETENIGEILVGVALLDPKIIESAYKLLLRLLLKEDCT